MYYPSIKAKISSPDEPKRHSTRSRSKKVLSSSLNIYRHYDPERKLGFSFCSPEKSEKMILKNVKLFKKLP